MKADDSDPQAFSIVFQLLTGLLIGFFGLITMSLRTSGVSDVIVNLALAAILYGSASIFMFSALKRIELSNFMVIFSARALFGVIGSTMLFGEGLSIRQFVGAGLLIGGILVINLKSSKFSFGKNELWALLAALCFGMANVNDRFLVKSLEIYFYTSTAFIVPAIILGAIYYKHLGNVLSLFRIRLLWKMILLCSLYGIGAIAFFMALKISPSASAVITANLFTVIVTVLMGIVFLKEKENMPNKIIGMILAFIGQLLIL